MEEPNALCRVRHWRHLPPRFLETHLDVKYPPCPANSPKRSELALIGCRAPQYYTALQHIKTTQCKMSNLSNLLLIIFQGVWLIQNFIGQAQREKSRLTKAVGHQEIPQIQLYSYNHIWYLYIDLIL